MSDSEDMQRRAAENLAWARRERARELESEARASSLGRSLAQLLEECAAQAATPEAIAAYERTVAEAQELEARERRRAVVDRLEAMRIPVREDVVRMMLAGQLGPWPALREVRIWLSVPSKILVLIGDVGQGKTVACSSMRSACETCIAHCTSCGSLTYRAPRSRHRIAA